MHMATLLLITPIKRSTVSSLHLFEATFLMISGAYHISKSLQAASVSVLVMASVSLMELAYHLSKNGIHVRSAVKVKCLPVESK